MGFSVTSGADTKKIKLWTSLPKFTENSTKLNDFKKVIRPDHLNDA
jgi:hypothetical protein